MPSRRPLGPTHSHIQWPQGLWGMKFPQRWRRTVFLKYNWRITSIYQPTNAHIISHKTLLKPSDMFRSCQIIIRELCSLLKLYYGIHNSIRICIRDVVAVGYIMLCCGAVARCASSDAHLATAPQHVPTQHDMLPQHLVCKYELNCEYCNITLARSKAPWWWSEKIETCRSVLKCFKKLFYVKLYAHSLVDK